MWHQCLPWMTFVKCILQRTTIAIGQYFISIIDPCLSYTILTSILIHYRSAIGRCSECTSVDGCGFCLSSLQCLSGTQTGPSEGAICPSWTYSNTTCPGKSLTYLSINLYMTWFLLYHFTSFFCKSCLIVETTWIVPVVLLKSNVPGAPPRTLVSPFPMLSPAIAEESCSKLLVLLITYQVPHSNYCMYVCMHGMYGCICMHGTYG